MPWRKDEVPEKRTPAELQRKDAHQVHRDSQPWISRRCSTTRPTEHRGTEHWMDAADPGPRARDDRYCLNHLIGQST